VLTDGNLIATRRRSAEKIAPRCRRLQSDREPDRDPRRFDEPDPIRF
jgi:hypothetical protein